MVSIQKSLINLFLSDLKSSTGYAVFAYRLNLKEPKLIAQLVSSILYDLGLGDEIRGLISGNEFIEVTNLNHDNSSLAFVISECLLTLLDLISHNGWNEDI